MSAPADAAASAGPILRDIHLPPAPSWWPPAPGWWLLAGALACVAAVLARTALRRWRARRWRAAVMAELERIAGSQGADPDPARCAAQVSQVLRRAGRVIDPASATLRNGAWLAFLDSRLPPAQSARAPFERGAGRVLVEAPFRAPGDAALAGVDVPALLALAREWLQAALPRGREHA
jgi:uncharacterized protein DUF4381